MPASKQPQEKNQYAGRGRGRVMMFPPSRASTKRPCTPELVQVVQNRWSGLDKCFNTRLDTVNNQRGTTCRKSDVTDLLDKVVELLLGVGVFLGHLFVLGLPLVAGLLEGLDFAFVVAGLDVGLTEPVTR
jgi:hypothetical protein